MAFFLIVPAWLLCLIAGITLACFQGLRRTAAYLVTVSTGATLVSFSLSTTVLYFGPRIGLQWFGRWSGIALIVTYILAIIGGGLMGSFVGILLTRKLLLRR